jgi:Fe-S-cluster containining protein
MSSFDCRACGACCTNAEENRREGYRDWVEVVPGDELLLPPERLPAHLRRAAARLVVHNQAGAPHLRLEGERCLALRGRLGRRVSCAIYEIRPRACRRVEAGGDRCRQYRRERGID